MTQKTKKIQKKDRCSFCHGTGYILTQDNPCEACRGSGKKIINDDRLRQTNREYTLTTSY